MSAESPVIAIAGATGAVGEEFLRLLEERRTPFRQLKVLASARSVGRQLSCGERRLAVEELTEEAFAGVDLALFSAGGAASRRFAPVAVDAGALVVDNSSAFRMDPAVPLVVPEVNPEAIAGGARLIANPNCSTILMVTAVDPLRRAFGVRRIAVATYQAVSGAGAAAMEELRRQTAAVLAGERTEARLFGEPCAFNVFSHDSAVDPVTGRNVEEQKMVDEARKIWADPGLAVTATCVRVPVLRAHAEAVNLTLGRPATEAEARAALAAAPGVQLVDDRQANRFPTSLAASGRDPVLVGRLRGDESQAVEEAGGERRFHGFDLFLAGDQLRKGAALNALQIAEVALSG
jgi:aspartate-semialdehyde dehydrogenase